MGPRINGHSPWGWIDYLEIKADGIYLVGTPGHGGFWLSPNRLAELKAKFPKLENTFAGFPWFEEDCDSVYVILAFPQYFAPWNVESANKQLVSMKDYYKV